MTRLQLLLGDQLDPTHPLAQRVEPNRVWVLIEARSETDTVPHHIQKVLAIFAAMRQRAADLKAQGHRVRYVALDDPSNRGSITDNLTALCKHYQAQEVGWLMPDEWRVDQDLQTWAHTQAPGLGVQVQVQDTQHFYTPREGVAQLLRGLARWRQEDLYRRLRVAHRVLMDGPSPVGGRWNFDADNRQPWRGTPQPPPDPRPRHAVPALWQMLRQQGVATVGQVDAQALRWPLTRAEALAQLQAFVQHALPHFGPYQDALPDTPGRLSPDPSETWRLFHSQLSFALNVKLLNPREVVAAAETAYQDGQVPLASAEGFIRQVLGWREYVRGVYWAHMPGYVDRNALGHERELPVWFWSGQTHMRCLSQAISQTLREAYAHHIQRLMVIGNFALLAGLSPQAVHRWYLAVYIDAFEWVELPNTLGMSQWADGGLMATKPYVSGAAYLQRMGDHCRHCRYQPKERVGERACPFNALYWDFMDRHAAALAQVPRLAPVLHQLRRMPGADRQALRAQAQQTLSRLDQL